MADVPHEAPHIAAKGGLQSLKKLPPWAWVAILGGGLLVVLYMRHSSSKASQAASTTDPNANPNSTTDPNSTGYIDPYANSSDPYASGGGIDPNSIYGSGLYGGGSGSGYYGTAPLPAPAGPTTPTDTGGTGTATAAPPTAGITNTFSPSVTNSPTIVTGGGAPVRPDVHSAPLPPCPVGFHRVNGQCVPYGPGGPHFNHGCPPGFDWNYTKGACTRGGK